MRTELSDVSIRRLAPHDVATAALWDGFVMAHPQSTFFHRAGWQKILRAVFQHETYFLYAQREGAVLGVLPLGHVKSWLFGNALVGLPFAVYGGVVATNEGVAQALECEAQAIAQRLRVAYLESRNRKACHTDWPTQSLYVTFRKALQADADSNMREIPRKQRAMVRKGIQRGLVSVLDGDVERFFPLYADNSRRHGSPALPKRYFKALLDEFGADCEILTVLAPDGRPLSSVLSFYFRDEVLPYYAGDAPAAREVAANDFKYWELMRRACARGIRVFDYGRSKQGTGSYAFKKNWGFEPTPLHYEYCLYQRTEIPQNNPSNARYQPLIAVWRRLPNALATWLGPYIVRSLG